MAYLVYCIAIAPVVEGEPLLGVAGREVGFVCAHGLGAAVSELAVAGGTPPVAELLAYGKVVEALHHRQAVVPMRYGCFLEGLPAVERLLAERQPQYEALLKDLAGHVEMGLRILLPEPRETAAPAAPPPLDGGNYLARRQAHYRRQEEGARQHQALLERYVQAFVGLYDQQRTETAVRAGIVVLSLYFLIRVDQIGRFRECFQRLAETADAKAMISGPWPPYNFVATAS